MKLSSPRSARDIKPLSLLFYSATYKYEIAILSLLTAIAAGKHPVPFRTRQ